MFTKGDKVYADAFKLLRHKEINMVAVQTQGTDEEWREESLENPIKVEKDGNYIKIGGYFRVRPKNFSYVEVKTAVIKMRYSNDDQIALMLNKDSSEEDALLYEKMQEWRNFAATIATEVSKHNNE